MLRYSLFEMDETTHWPSLTKLYDKPLKLAIICAHGIDQVCQFVPSVRQLFEKTFCRHNPAMTNRSFPLNVIMPLAGKGERFTRCGYQRPKPLIQVLGRPLIVRVIESLGLHSGDLLQVIYHRSLEKERITDLIRGSFPDLQITFCCIEQRTRGASETVLRGIDQVPAGLMDRPALVADGDGIVDAGVLASFRQVPGNVIFCTHHETGDPTYSYVDVDERMQIQRIAEKVRLSPWACVGMYGFASTALLQQAAQATLKTSTPEGGEYYLSSAVRVLLQEGQGVRAEPVEKWACLGTPKQLQNWCRQQVLLSYIGRTHAAFESVPNQSTGTTEFETGYDPPSPVPAAWYCPARATSVL